MPSVVDDLRGEKKGGEERDIIRQQGERESERGVVTGARGREIPLLGRRSRLSSASLRNASRQKWSRKAHSLENVSPARNKLDFRKEAWPSVSTDMDSMWRLCRKTAYFYQQMSVVSSRPSAVCHRCPATLSPVPKVD